LHYLPRDYIKSAETEQNSRAVSIYQPQQPACNPAASEICLECMALGEAANPALGSFGNFALVGAWLVVRRRQGLSAWHIRTSLRSGGGRDGGGMGEVVVERR
jgi:hypothetical protein